MIAFRLNHYRLEAGRLKSWLEAGKHSKECSSLQRDVVFIVRFMRIDIAIDVGIDHLIGDISARRNEKSPAPKMPTPIAFADLWKFLLNLPRAAPLGHLHEVSSRNMQTGWCFNDRTASKPALRTEVSPA